MQAKEMMEHTKMAKIWLSARKYKRICSLVVFLLALMLHEIPTYAVIQDDVLKNYAQRVWQVQDGLPAFNVQTIAQTPDNYLWVGTTGGLVRFDGESFVVFNPSTEPAFKVEGVASLMVARNGDLWIGTAGGGLVRYQQGRFTRFSAGEGFATNFIRSILEDNRGRIWFATYDGLYYLENGKPRRLQSSLAAVRSTLFAMVQDKFGAIWVGGVQLIRIYDGTVTVIQSAEHSPPMGILSLAVSGNTLWVGRTSGLYKLQLNDSDMPGHLTHVPGDTGMVRALHVFPDGSLWIGTIGEGSLSYRDGVIRRLIMPASLPSNAVSWIFQDRQKNIWIGSQGGLIRLTPSSVSVLHLKDASDVDFQTLYSDPTGPLWVASSRLFEIQANQLKEVNFPGLKDAQVSSMLRDHDGSLWVGTNGKGLFHLTKSETIRYGDDTGLNNNYVRALLQSHNGDIWIGTSSRLNRWHDGKIETLVTTAAKNVPSGIHMLFEDTEGDIWIGADQGLFLWRNGHFLSNEATQGLADSPVWSIFEDTNHSLWIGTVGNGLFRWKNHSLAHLKTLNGLLPSKIYAILETKNGRIWLSSPNGIWAVMQSDLNALADGTHSSPPVQFYSVLDGTYAAQICGGFMHAGALRPNGDLWFPSLNGPVLIAPEQQEKIRNTPPVVLHRVLADGREVPIEQISDLGTHISHLEVHYGAIDLHPQDELRYRYRMEGFDRQWVEAGLRRVAYYTNLPPGKYIFRVQVYRLDSPGLHTEASVVLIRKPAFYQTWWFYACCAIVAALCIWLVYREKTQRIRERFQAVLQERSRVAREMHDTLLRGCTSVSSLLEALWITKAIPDETNHTLLDSARLQMNATIEEARQAIWGLHNNIPSADIATLLQEICNQIGQQYSLPIDYLVVGKPRSINQEASHHLLMVTREALFNAVRHGTPSKVRLTIQFSKDEIRIGVEDNGKGFTMTHDSNQSSRRHYGLAVMRERIESIGGSFDMSSGSGHGTRISFAVPLGRFRTSSNVDTLNA
jgi:ligand-binding sensor domain-containing protein/signal transduction histidine kinase